MASEQSYDRRWWILAFLCVSLIIINLDNTILNVALPTFVRDLHATSSQLEWIVDSYILIFAGLLLTCGSFGDRFGRRKALIAGLLIFIAFSVVAANCHTANHLIISRGLMGIGAAIIMPATLSILTNVFPEGERIHAIGLWSASAGIAIPSGPIVGGWLLERFSYGSIFYVNIPVALIGLAGAVFVIRESRDPDPAPIDWLGVVLSFSGLTVLLYGIIEAPSKGWGSAEILLSFAIAALLLGLFVAWERRSEHPMLEMSLFSNARFTGANLALTFLFFSLLGTTFFLTQYLQFSLGYSTLGAGLRMIPIAIGIFIGAPLSAKLVGQFGTKLVVAVGLVITAAGCGSFALAESFHGYGLVAAAMFLGGLGMGIAMTPSTDSVMGSVSLENAGVGSAMNDTTREIGGALGVAVVGSLLATVYHSSMTEAVKGLPDAAAGPAGNSIGAALHVAGQLGGQTGATLIDQAQHAFRNGMAVSALVAGGVSIVATVIVLVLLPARAAERSEETTEVPAQVPVEMLEFDT